MAVPHDETCEYPGTDSAAETNLTTSRTTPSPSPSPPATIVIVGGGIVGLTLALGLKEHLSLTAEIYEQSKAFCHDVGAGMGMYPNGLRVLRSISPALLKKVQAQGCAYQYRRWERHDGTEVAVAEESALSHTSDDDDDDNDDSDGHDNINNNNNLQTIGIRRWRLHKVLFDAACEAGIPIYFDKRVTNVESLHNNNNNNKNNNTDNHKKQPLVEITFEDGTRRTTEILFAADGGKSKVREIVTHDNDNNDDAPKLEYTGVTCLMGIAETKNTPFSQQQHGMFLPSSSSSSATQCHGAFFPTGQHEMCFQFHLTTGEKDADPDNWGSLSQQVGKRECAKLAKRLRKDGWHEKYVQALEHSTNAVRVGFCLLTKGGLDKFVYGDKGRIVLVGDAAHPPIPYLGQGAQMGLEDAGVIISLLKELCMQEDGITFAPANFGHAMCIYETMRVPRTREILEKGKLMGVTQQKRACNAKYNQVREEHIQRDVFFHKTLQDLLPAVTYDFKMDVANVLQNEPVHLPVLEEEEE